MKAPGMGGMVHFCARASSCFFSAGEDRVPGQVARMVPEVSRLYTWAHASARGKTVCRQIKCTIWIGAPRAQSAGVSVQLGERARYAAQSVRGCLH